MRRLSIEPFAVFTAFLTCAVLPTNAAHSGVAGEMQPCFTVAGEWAVKVQCGERVETITVDPPQRVVVDRERHDSLPVFNPKKSGWTRGLRPCGIRAYECSVRFSLDPSSVKICMASTGRELKRDVEYRLSPDWGTIGLADGTNAAWTGPVLISYAYLQRRIDTVVLRADGRIALLKGEPHVVTPTMPKCGEGEKFLGTIYVDAGTRRITDGNLLPLLPSSKTQMCAFNPPRRTCEKLRAGKKVKIMAWGDSVTAGGFVAKADKWQNRFISWLRKTYPAAEIELVSNAWPGRTTRSYLREPPGSKYNFKETVLDACPDLVISEFVNDGGMKENSFSEIYEKTLLPAFRTKGIEWVILTPHYVRPDWMNLAGVKRCDDDPRTYVKLVRAFARKEGVGLADASMLWGGLWRRGIPYVTLLVNDINHPNAFGMSLFDEALRELFSPVGH